MSGCTSPDGSGHCPRRRSRQRRFGTSNRQRRRTSVARYLCAASYIQHDRCCQRRPVFGPLRCVLSTPDSPVTPMVTAVNRRAAAELVYLNAMVGFRRPRTDGRRCQRSVPRGCRKLTWSSSLPFVADLTQVCAIHVKLDGSVVVGHPDVAVSIGKNILTGFEKVPRSAIFRPAVTDHQQVLARHVELQRPRPPFLHKIQVIVGVDENAVGWLMCWRSGM